MVGFMEIIDLAMSRLQLHLNRNQKVLITGASGLLGRAIVSKFKKHSWIVIGLANSRVKDDLIKIDLLDDEAIRKVIHDHKPNVIIHCAAERSPDKVESDYERSRSLNVTCSRNLAFWARVINAVFIHMSTDYVFDGTRPPYKEIDTPNPLNMYGKTKYEAETEILKVNPDSCILRIPILYGDEEYLGESAISSLIKHLQTEEPVKVSNLERRYPSHTNDIAKICYSIAKKKQRSSNVHSIYHWCGKEGFTKYEMMKVIAEVFSLSTAHIKPDDQPSSGAVRPVNTKLCCTRLENLGFGKHTCFKEGVRHSFGKFFDTKAKK